MERDIDLLNKVPKIYHEAITNIYKDEDGYWAYIENGYKVENYFAEHIIHEDTLAEFKRVFTKVVIV